MSISSLLCVKNNLGKVKKKISKKLRKILTLKKILGLRKILGLGKILGLKNISRYPSSGTLRAIQPSGNAVAGISHAGRLLLREVIDRRFKGRRAVQEYIITAREAVRGARWKISTS